MAVTQAQILSVLNIIQNFNLLNTSAPVNYETAQDATNWASIGISTGNSDTVNTIIQIVDPLGSIVYQNANWVAQTFGSPDMTLSSLTSSSKTLNVYTGTTIPITGNYVINVAVQVTPHLGTAVVVADTFNCNLSSGFAPSAPSGSPQGIGQSVQLLPPALPLILSETYNCQQATFTSTDVTTYNPPSGWTITSTTKVHITTPPQGSTQFGNSTPQTAITSSATQNYLASPLNPLWTGAYQSSLSVIMNFRDANGNTCQDRAIVYADTCVTCDNNYCVLECVMDDIMQDLTEAIAVGNQNVVAKLERRASWGTILFQRIIQANICGNTTLAAAYMEQFYKFTGSKNCNCNHCSNTSPAPVIPTTSITGATGATGPQGPQGDTGAQGPAGDAAVSIIYNQFPNTSTTGTGSVEALETVPIVGGTLKANFDMIHIHAVFSCGTGGNVDLSQYAAFSFNGLALNLAALFSSADFQVAVFDHYITRITNTSAKYESVISAWQTRAGIDVPSGNLEYGATEVHRLGTISSGLDFTTSMDVVAGANAQIGSTTQVVLNYLRIDYEPKT